MIFFKKRIHPYRSTGHHYHYHDHHNHYHRDKLIWWWLWLPRVYEKIVEAKTIFIKKKKYQFIFIHPWFLPYNNEWMDEWLLRIDGLNVYLYSMSIYIWSINKYIIFFIIINQSVSQVKIKWNINSFFWTKEIEREWLNKNLMHQWFWWWNKRKNLKQ